MRSGVTQERKALFRQLLAPLGMELGIAWKNGSLR